MNLSEQIDDLANGALEVLLRTVLSGGDVVGTLAQEAAGWLKAGVNAALGMARNEATFEQIEAAMTAYRALQRHQAGLADNPQEGEL